MPADTIDSTHNGAAASTAANAGATHGTANAAQEELHHLIADIEELATRFRNSADPQIHSLQAHLQDGLALARKAIKSGAHDVNRQARAALTAGDHYARAQPWQVVGLAAVTGLAVGFLVARR